MMGPPTAKAGHAGAPGGPASAQPQSQGVKRSAKQAFEGEWYFAYFLLHIEQEKA
jgi:hypothetical protein